MNSTTLSLPQRPAHAASSVHPNSTRYLYSACALSLLGLTFLGFRNFYLHGQTARGAELVPSTKGLLVAHGLAMTLWILLFAVQPLLIAGRKRKLHMTLGIFGAALAVCIVPLGVWTAIAMAKAEPLAIHSGGLNARQFLVVQFNSLLMFATFVTAGIVNRRRPEIHRPMLFLATLATMGAVFGRIAPLRQLVAGTAWSTSFGPYFFPLIVGLVFLATTTALTRAFDRWLTGGLAMLIVADALAMKVGTTSTWEQIGRLIVR